MDHIGQAFEMLGYVMGTAIAGLFIHGVIVLPLIFFIFTRKNPYAFIKNVSDAIVTAYGTDSRYGSSINALSYNSDQRQISLCNINAFFSQRGHENKGYDQPT